ncbi:hypothetical protein GCK72_001989 [Caenorhabditis remanei]|nr:hypothetical protein GCK72_001989 [Caenorhabditis remanei]KAF1770171.1 hypothetical protein GCK72_001989 [Caenorhabditis remanei]
MSYRSTALVFILSLLAVLVINSMADSNSTVNGSASAGIPTMPPVLETDPPVVSDATAGPADAANGGSGATLSAIGALATLLLANFF